MAAEVICDGCGKREPMVFYPNGRDGWHKPQHWYSRQDKDGIQDACCRECVKKVAEKTGKPSTFFPL